MMHKPSWDEYFLRIAKAVGLRYTCTRASSGVVLVKGKRILATGYNGAPAGELECLEVGCKLENNHCIRTIHGEQNAIDCANKYNVDLCDATLYEWYVAFSEESKDNYYQASGTYSVANFPCKTCKWLIMKNRIKRVLIQYDGGGLVEYI